MYLSTAQQAFLFVAILSIPLTVMSFIRVFSSELQALGDIFVAA
jgi:hypothetical protein